MREILFRGKAICGNEWIKGDFLTDTREYNRTCDKAYIAPHWDKLNVPIGVAPETIGQYTGLIDNNGAEIFEGDIVKIHDYPKRLEHVGKVIFNNARFWVIGFYFIHYNAPFDAWEDMENVEVVGNIYDNPELLEETKNEIK